MTFMPSNSENQIIYYANINFIITSIINNNNNISFILKKHNKSNKGNYN